MGPGVGLAVVKNTKQNDVMQLDEAIAKIDAAKPLTPEEALAKIKELASAGKIEFSPSDGIEALQDHVDVILRATGHPRAWVSDRSCIGDFRPEGDSKESFEFTISDRLGMIVTCGDYIVDVARRLKNNGSA